MLKENMRKFRRKALMTQAEMANALGYTSSAVTMWESGTRKPPSDLIPKIAEVLNCSIEDLFEGGENSDKGRI